MGKPAVYYNPNETPVIIQASDPDEFPPTQIGGREWVVLDSPPKEQLDNDSLVKCGIPASIDDVGDAAKPVFKEYFAALQKYEDDKAAAAAEKEAATAAAVEEAPAEEAPAKTSRRRSASDSKPTEVGDTSSSTDQS